jgi:hypothetical protein
MDNHDNKWQDCRVCVRARLCLCVRSGRQLKGRRLGAAGGEHTHTGKIRMRQIETLARDLPRFGPIKELKELQKAPAADRESQIH